MSRMTHTTEAFFGGGIASRLNVEIRCVMDS